MSHKEFYGSITALITPFKNGDIDEKAYQDFVQWQLNEGTNGFVPCGTTGEAPTLSDEEYGLLTRLCIEVVKGKAPVIAGCGSNATKHAIHLTCQAQNAGADAALHVVPYYNKPSQEGLYQHFKAIHDNCDIPVFIYNIPGRSIVNMTPETMARLSGLPRIIGVKDATGNLQLPLKRDSFAVVILSSFPVMMTRHLRSWHKVAWAAFPLCRILRHRCAPKCKRLGGMATSRRRKS